MHAPMRLLMERKIVSAVRSVVTPTNNLSNCLPTESTHARNDRAVKSAPRYPHGSRRDNRTSGYLWRYATLFTFTDLHTHNRCFRSGDSPGPRYSPRHGKETEIVIAIRVHGFVLFYVLKFALIPYSCLLSTFRPLLLRSNMRKVRPRYVESELNLQPT
jgi:hypothetical protein